MMVARMGGAEIRVARFEIFFIVKGWKQRFQSFIDSNWRNKYAEYAAFSRDGTASWTKSSVGGVANGRFL
jgi:hypothetical protein